MSCLTPVIFDVSNSMSLTMYSTDCESMFASLRWFQRLADTLSDGPTTDVVLLRVVLFAMIVEWFVSD